MYCQHYANNPNDIRKWPLWNMFGKETFQNYHKTTSYEQIAQLSMLKTVKCLKCKRVANITLEWIPKKFIKIICYNLRCMYQHTYDW